MTDIKCRMKVGGFNTFQGSGLDIRKALGEIPYASATVNCIECLLVSVMVW